MHLGVLATHSEIALVDRQTTTGWQQILGREANPSALDGGMHHPMRLGVY